MKYLGLERIFLKIAEELANPGLSIIPWLHKTNVEDKIICKGKLWTTVTNGIINPQDAQRLLKDSNLTISGSQYRKRKPTHQNASTPSCAVSASTK